MGYNAKKTEHCGAKHGGGAYYGRKVDAKQHSRKKRRSNAKKAIERGIREEVDEFCDAIEAGLL